jgi:hypothetical protein
MRESGLVYYLHPQGGGSVWCRWESVAWVMAISSGQACYRPQGMEDAYPLTDVHSR